MEDYSICESGDGKQSARNRLFVQWFKVYKGASNIYFEDAEIESEGIVNYAALIVERNNPNLESILLQTHAPRWRAESPIPVHSPGQAKRRPGYTKLKQERPERAKVLIHSTFALSGRPSLWSWDRSLVTFPIAVMNLPIDPLDPCSL